MSEFIDPYASSVGSDVGTRSPQARFGSGFADFVGDLDDLNHYGQVEVPDEDPDTSFSWKTFWAYTGPGWLMSIAYLDPGNLESDLQAGAYTGYQLLWVILLATSMGLMLQILAARLGVVTGKHLAELCKEEYPGKAGKLLWVMAEVAIIGADIQEVVGSAIAFHILFGLPVWVGCILTGLDTFTFLGLHYFGVRHLEAFFAMLIATMCFCFMANFAEMTPDGTAIARGFLPSLSSYASIPAVGIVGAVVMPHNLYLHSALVQSRQVDRTNAKKVAEAIKYFSIEAAAALFVTFILNAAVVAVFAHGFFDEDCALDRRAYVDGECQKIGLSGAGVALEQVLGNTALMVWAVGLLAAGQSSTMCTVFAGQFVMEGFLDLQISPWKRVAFTRAIALVPAVLVALTSSEKDFAVDGLDQWLNVLQSVQLPFAVLPLLHFTSSARLMNSFRNGTVAITVTWLIALMVVVFNVYLVVDFIMSNPDAPNFGGWFAFFVVVTALFYFSFIFYLIQRDIRRGFSWVLREKSVTDSSFEINYNYTRPFLASPNVLDYPTAADTASDPYRYMVQDGASDGSPINGSRDEFRDYRAEDRDYRDHY